MLTINMRNAKATVDKIVISLLPVLNRYVYNGPIRSQETNQVINNIKLMAEREKCNIINVLHSYLPHNSLCLIFHLKFISNKTCKPTTNLSLSLSHSLSLTHTLSHFLSHSHTHTLSLSHTHTLSLFLSGV